MANELNSLFSPEYLAEVRGLMGPTAQDKRSALTTGLLSTAMGLLANRSPYFGVALGNAGLYGIGQYQGALEAARHGRAEEIKGALTLRDLKTKLQQDAAIQAVRDKLARGDYNITKPGVSPATASVFGTAATPDQSGIDQQALVRDLLATGQLPAKDWIELQLKQSEFGAPVQINTPAGPRFAFPSKSGQFKTSEQVPFHQAPAPKDEYTYNPATNAWDVDPQALARDIMKRGAGATRISNVVSTEKTYGGELAKGLAQSDLSLKAEADKAQTAMERAKRVIGIIDSGQAYTGAGADWKLAFGKAAKAAGLDYAGDAIANTERLGADLAQGTLDMIHASGLGSGNGFTDTDRKFLEMVATGKITYDATTIRRAAQIHQNVAAATMAKWNKRSKMIPKSAIEGTGLDTSPVLPDPVGGKFLGFEPAK